MLRQVCVGLTLFAAAFESYVNWRQLSRLHHPAPPAKILPVLNEVQKSQDAEQLQQKDAAKSGQEEHEQQDNRPARIFSRSQSYTKDKIRFGLFSSAVELVQGLAMLLGSAKLWSFSASLVDKPAPLNTTVAFLILSYVLGLVTSLPLSYVKTFWLEEKHGFNKSTKKTWVMDQFKSTALMAVLGLPLTVGATVGVVDRYGPAFVKYLCACLLGLQIVAVPTYTYIIAPMFNKFTSLSDYPEHKALQDRIEKLAKRLEFPLGKIYLVDGSKRSAHSNAYFTGLPFLTKQIVLFDTLIKEQTPEQIEGVLAHELGHWKNNDTLRLLAMGQTTAFVTLTATAALLFNEDLYRAFGIYPSSKNGNFGVPVIIGFQLTGALLSPLNVLVSFAINAFTRRLEFAADRFAGSLGYTDEIMRALAILSAKNATVYDVDPLFSAMNHSHPTVGERLEALDKMDNKKTE